MPTAPTNPNHPAFRNPYEAQSNGDFPGLTKREYFAGQALMGILANQMNTGPAADVQAAEAVEHADALIAALNKDAK